MVCFLLEKAGEGGEWRSQRGVEKKANNKNVKEGWPVDSKEREGDGTKLDTEKAWVGRIFWTRRWALAT